MTRTLRCIRNILIGVLLVVLLLVMLGAAWIALVYIGRRGSCAVLPNGYMIGFTYIFGEDDDGHRDMVLRDRTGKVLIRTDYSMQFLRHPDRYERVIVKFPGDIRLDLHGEDLMPVVLYQDMDGQPTINPRYPKLPWSELSRHLAADESLGWYGIDLVHAKLRRSRKFQLVDCGTPWFNQGT